MKKSLCVQIESVVSNVMCWFDNIYFGGLRLIFFGKNDKKA